MGPARAMYCVVRGSGVIVITFIIVVARVIVNRSGVLSSIDEAYSATVVEERMAVTKPRMLRSCMIRSNNIRRS